MATSSKSATEPRRRRSPAPLSRRLGLWYAFSSVALFIGVAALLQRGVGTTLERAAEEVARDEALELREILSLSAGRRIEALRTEAEDERNEGVYFRILTSDRRVLIESPEMRIDALRSTAFPSSIAMEELRDSGIAVRSDDDVFRIFAIRLSPANGERHTVELAVDRTAEHRLLADYRALIWLTVVPAALLAILVGRQIAIRGLRPIDEMAKQVRRVGASSLDERVDAAAFPADLAPLAESFNEMLERLKEAFWRLSRFSGDIAHELRTPIANLRAELEVTLGRPRRVEEYRDVLGSSLEECERLSGRIDDLLFLARAETPEAALRRRPVDVARELGRLKELFDPVAAERGVELVVDATDGPAVNLDRGLFQRALSNLIENALRHTDSGGAVTIRCRARDRAVEVDVEDTGCGIPAEHVPRVFDRLYRVDSSRTRSTGGAGLGLAIVKSVAELHGGSATIESKVGWGTRIRLSLPT